MRKVHRGWHLVMWGVLGPIIVSVIALGLAVRAGGVSEPVESHDASMTNTPTAEVSP